MIYMDNAATTKISDKAIAAMEPYLNNEYGNPSGLYDLAKNAKNAIEEARSNIAATINGEAKNIFFTSGGTEADNWALNNAKYFGNHIITSTIEHHAVLNKCSQLQREGMDVTYVSTDEKGNIDLKELIENIREDTSLISIMFANNEIGTIEPIQTIGRIARERNITFHTDGVQAYAHIPIDVKEMNIDMLSASGHKFYGPKGVGFLYVREPEKISSYIYGGGQEKVKRAGTENVSSIVGMGVAAVDAMDNMENRRKKEISLRNYLINRVLNEIPLVRLNGDEYDRLPGNANFTIKGVEGTALVILLDNEGICVSSGSACSAGSDKPSHVLTAIGMPQELAYGTLRITLSYENTLEEINYLIYKLKEKIKMLRAASAI